MPTILVDQDNVLAKWEDSFHREFRSQYPHLRIPHPSERTAYNLAEGCDDEVTLAIADVMDTPGLYRDLDPMPGAAQALNALADLGVNVFICTTPWLSNSSCTADKLWWVDRHIGTGWSSRVIMTADKTVISGDLLIDDKPHITGAATPTWEHILFTQPYNAHLGGPRINGWWDVVDQLRPRLGREPVSA